MRKACRLFSMGIALSLLGFLVPSIGFPEMALKGIKKNIGGQPIVINSDTLEIDNKGKVVTFEGNVEARDSDIIIKCRKMLLHFIDVQDKQASDGSGFKIEKILAKGKVEITRADGGLATAEEAIFNQKDETIVLTGNPIVKQGDYFVEGAKITLFLRENRSVVEGSDNKKVRAVMSPKN